MMVYWPDLHVSVAFYNHTQGGQGEDGRKRRPTYVGVVNKQSEVLLLIFLYETCHIARYGKQKTENHLFKQRS